MKRFRFSLLSLLVGVVLAGGVVWLNMREQPATIKVYKLHEAPSRIEPNEKPERVLLSYGWPFTGYAKCSKVVGTKVIGGPFMLGLEYFNRFHWPSLAANIAIGLAIVFGGAAACEWLVRRRAAKAKE